MARQPLLCCRPGLNQEENQIRDCNVGRLLTFQKHILADGRDFCNAQLPSEQVFCALRFERLWAEHPQVFREITMVGRRVKLPRWQQAYGRDYRYCGEITPAIPVPAILELLLAFVQTVVDAKLNGLLVNWYQAELGHYIGPHRDSTDGLVNTSPILICSFGDERTFRLKKWRGVGSYDFRAFNGSILLIPFETNTFWTHEITKATQSTGKRISVTIRAFE